MTFTEDGALWLRTADFGDPREKRVLRKSDGDWTYLAGDMTYHRNKFVTRGFDRVINVWGADHEGQVPSLKAGVAALGVDPERLEIRLGQMISLASGRMSKRAGNAVDLDDLVDDIGPDAMRLLSLVNSPDQATLVDLDKVRAESKESPVFYVQMAYARIAGIGREADKRDVTRRPITDADLTLLSHPRELECPARPVGAARGGGAGLRRAGAAQGHDVGPGAGRPLPRLLPRLLRAALRRARRADPGPAVAGRSGPHRPQHRPRAARRHRPGEDVTPNVLPAPPLPRELLPDTAAIDAGGRLSVGGVDLLDLCQEVGTPVFVYDEAHLRRRCRQAVEAFGDGVAYASKAFFCLAMARLAHEEGMWIDVSTGGELHVALRAGVPAARLVLHGNNKSERELSAALTAGVGRIVIDSFDEIDRLDQLWRPGDSPKPQVLLRVTPGIEAHTHEYVQTGQDDSKFGFGIASGAAAEAVRRLRHPGSSVELVGVHAHIGSQIFELSSFERAIGVLAEFFSPLGLEELCVGGGLGVPYVEGEKAPSIAEWAAAVRGAAGAAGIPASVR